MKAREGVPGQAPPAPELMMALWLWATVEGVGSARQLTRLCEQHLAYRWLCGGVSMNYHTLSDFRVAHAAVLDQLLAGGVATLVAQGLVALDVLAQDGIRVRAAAGAGSFRRRERLGKLAAAATARVARLRAELEADPAAGDRRQQAAQQRAAREREERVQAALDRMSELEAERARREKTNKAEVSRQKEPRASTTDAQARTMKLADGGFRPAYNMQIVSAPRGQVIVAVDIDTTGSDRGLARPALEQLSAAGTTPSDYLVDGGFAKNDDIEWAHASGIALWCPPVHSKHGSDPYASRADDKPGWRIGASAWPASRARRSTSNAPRPSAPTLGRAAWGSAGCPCAAKRRPAPCCCGSRSPTTCCGRSYCSRPPGPLQLEIVIKYINSMTDGPCSLDRRSLSIHQWNGHTARGKPSSSAAREMPSPNPLHQAD